MTALATVTHLHPRKPPKVDRAHDRSPKLVWHKASGQYVLLYYRSDAATTRTSKSTGCSTLKDAEKWFKGERDRLGSVARGHEVDPTLAQRRATVGQLLDSLLEYYDSDKPDSARSVHSHVERHLRPAFGAYRADAFTMADLLRERRKWKAQGLADGSVNRYVQALKTAFEKGVSNGLLARVPTIDWPWYEEIAREEIVTDEELALVNSAEPWAGARRMNTAAAYIGMRFAEMQGLQWGKNVDIKTYTLILSPEETKTSKGRELRIPASMVVLRAVLDECWATREAGCPYVFQHEGGMIPEGRWTWAWHRAGLPQKPSRRPRSATNRKPSPPLKRFHDLRATAAVRLIENKVPESVVMLITGHRSARVFQRVYARMKAHHVEAAFDTLGRALGTTVTPQIPALTTLRPRSRRGRLAARSARHPVHAG